MMQMIKVSGDLCFLKNSDPRWLSAPALWLYTCTCLLFKNIFYETVWPIKAKLHAEPLGEGEKKVYIKGTGHKTIWPPCTYMKRKFNSLLIWSQKSYDLETWFFASRTRALQIIYK